MGDRHRNHEDHIIHTVTEFEITANNLQILSFPIPWASAKVAEAAVIVHTAAGAGGTAHIQGVTVEDGGADGTGSDNCLNETDLRVKNAAAGSAAGTRVDGHGNNRILTKGDKVVVRSHESGTPGGADGKVEVIVVIRKLGDRRIID